MLRAAEKITNPHAAVHNTVHNDENYYTTHLQQDALQEHVFEGAVNI